METAALPGVNGTKLMESANSEATVYKAFRALYIGAAFVGVKKFPEAMTFFARASEFRDQAKKALAKSDGSEVSYSSDGSLMGALRYEVFVRAKKPLHTVFNAKGRKAEIRDHLVHKIDSLRLSTELSRIAVHLFDIEVGSGLCWSVYDVFFVDGEKAVS